MLIILMELVQRMTFVLLVKLVMLIANANPMPVLQQLAWLLASLAVFILTVVAVP